jgi:PKD repeat protein
MSDNSSRFKVGRRRQGIFRFDSLLLAFLAIGWSLIFTTATLGLYNDGQQWLPGLVSQVSADYSAVPTEALQIAQIHSDMIEAVKQDQIHLFTTPTPLASPSATPTLEPTLTLVLGLLAVSVDAPAQADEGSSITVIAKDEGLGLGTVTYAWDTDADGQFDDDSGASISLVFYDEGDYPISVQATDIFGQVDTNSATIQVINVPPLVELAQSFESDEGQELVFAAMANDPGRDIMFYEWDFGDGSPKVANTLHPRHTYQNNGIYPLNLKVSDIDGGVSQAVAQVKISNLPPLVNAGPDQVTSEGTQISLNATATDPGLLDKLAYAWDLDYDGRNFVTDVSGQTASVTYPNGPVTHVVAVRVKDGDGKEVVDTLKVTVNNVPPVISSVTNDSPADEGSAVALAVTATDAGDDLLTYSFDWDNDGTFDAINQPATVSNIWLNQGSYTVRVRVDDGDGGQAFAETVVSTVNTPPVAVANVDPVRFEGESAAFNGNESYDLGTNDLLTFGWDFGDGATAPGPNTTHVYADNGVYSATLTVTDDSGASSVAAAAVTVLNANPTAEAGSDQTVNEGANIGVTFAGTASDPGTADVLELAWDFDYRDNTFIADATGPGGTYVYPALDGPADYIVALRVRDDDYPFPTDNGGGVGEVVDTLRLTVQNVPPWNVRAGGPYSGVETIPVVLTGAAEDAPADLPTLTYAWDLDNNPNFETVGNPVSFTWNRSGVYTVRLRVTDKDGGESFASTQVTVENALPTAQANGPYTATINFPITFSAAGSSDPTGEALTYQWDFGDGSPVVATSTITVTHPYSDDGVYTATLRVTDASGGTDTNNALVIIPNQPPVAVAQANPQTVGTGQQINFSASGSSDPDDTALIYTWDFDDGTTATGMNVSYRYSTPKVYTVTLTVTDDDGVSDRDRVIITVANGQPTADAGPDQTANEGDTVTLTGAGSDPDNDPLIFDWDFNYDGVNFNLDTTGQTVARVFNNGPATITIALRVRDGNGGSNIDTLVLTVGNVAPIAAAGGNQTVLEGDQVSFNGTAFDPGVNDTLTYEWDFDYDGVTFDVNGTGRNVSTTYPDGPANYTVALRVTDSDNAFDINTLQVQVTNAPPRARAGSNLTVTAGQQVTLDGSGSSDPAGSADDPLTYEWDIDYDGSNFNPDVTGVTPTYTWLTSGTYTIMLRVTDADGDSGSDTITATVNP